MGTNVQVQQNAENFWLLEEILDSEERLCSAEWDNLFLAGGFFHFRG
jgi:hypothetical protein